MALIRHWETLTPDAVGRGIQEFADILERPSRIVIEGRDRSRARALVTLLHGNEPSGLMALHRLLREAFVPAVDLHCFVVALDAARLEPRFSHRQVPGKRDYNRCFRPPFEQDLQGCVCEAILKELRNLGPEAVIDMHNTSGEGPAFALATRYDSRIDRLVSLFSDRLIITDLRLGSLMETTSPELPVITVECGGAFEESAHRMAYESLRRYAGEEDIFRDEGSDWGLEILDNPVRVELLPDASLSFAEAPGGKADLTLRPDLEHHNFGLVPERTFLGWLRQEGMEILRAFDPQKRDRFDEFYRLEDDVLYTRVPQKMFMITTNARIAKSDCLWYAVKA